MGLGLFKRFSRKGLGKRFSRNLEGIGTLFLIISRAISKGGAFKEGRPFLRPLIFTRRD